MECPNCGENSVSAGEIPLPSGKLGCFVCRPEPPRHLFNPGRMHVKGDNPWAPRMSRTKEDVIARQRVMPDSDGEVIDPKTGKEAAY